MVSFKYVITNVINIHSRPVSMLAKIVKDNKCNANIKKDNIVKDLKSIIGMMKLNLKVGDEIEIIIEAETEELENIAKTKIMEFFEKTF